MNPYLALFVAGILAGIGITILATLLPDIPAVLRDYRRFFRERKRARSLPHGRQRS